MKQDKQNIMLNSLLNIDNINYDKCIANPYKTYLIIDQYMYISTIDFRF